MTAVKRPQSLRKVTNDITRASVTGKEKSQEEKAVQNLNEADIASLVGMYAP